MLNRTITGQPVRSSIHQSCKIIECINSITLFLACHWLPWQVRNTRRIMTRICTKRAADWHFYSAIQTSRNRHTKQLTFLWRPWRLKIPFNYEPDINRADFRSSQRANDILTADIAWKADSANSTMILRNPSVQFLTCIIWFDTLLYLLLWHCMSSPRNRK